MTRTWKTFGLQTVLAAALVVAPVTGNAAEDETKINSTKSLRNRIANLDKELKGLKSQIKSMNETLLRIDKIEGDVGDIAKGLTSLDERYRKSMEKIGTDMNEVKSTLKELAKKNGSSTPKEGNDLKSRVARIERILEQIDRKINSTSLYPSPEEGGRVLLRNDYDEEVLFVINGRSYRLAPGTSRVLDVPAGTLTFEVITPGWGLLRRASRTLLPNETRRIVVGP
jgi:hypothetical protein